MAKLIEVKVTTYDANTGFAKLVDQNEIDDVVTYDIFVPSFFGGQLHPYPKPGEKLLIRYGRTLSGGGGPQIMECFRLDDFKQAVASM